MCVSRSRTEVRPRQTQTSAYRRYVEGKKSQYEKIAKKNQAPKIQKHSCLRFQQKKR